MSYALRLAILGRLLVPCGLRLRLGLVILRIVDCGLPLAEICGDLRRFAEGGEELMPNG